MEPHSWETIACLGRGLTCAYKEGALLTRREESQRCNPTREVSNASYGVFQGWLYWTHWPGAYKLLSPGCSTTKLPLARDGGGREYARRERGAASEYELSMRIDLSMSASLGLTVREQRFVAQADSRHRVEDMEMLELDVNVEFPVLHDGISMNGRIEPLKCPRYTRGSATMQITSPDQKKERDRGRERGIL